MADTERQITIATDSDVVTLTVGADESIENIKALIEVETGIPLLEQRLYLDGRPISTGQSVQAAGVKNGDLLRLQRVQAGGMGMGMDIGAGAGMDASAGAGAGFRDPTMDDAVALREQWHGRRDIMESLTRDDPQLAQAIVNNDLGYIMAFLRQLQFKQMRERAEAADRIAALNADPLNPDNQRAIADRIQQANIDDNYEIAMENTPESFVQSITMLYVHCEINGFPLHAFVDSGAQMTIVSPLAAEKCGLTRLIDKRYHGLALGVGSAKIVGRIHTASLQLGGSYFACSFTVVEGDGLTLILGLDMLRKHQMCIDLKSTSLRIGDTSVPFLAEQDLPDEYKIGGRSRSGSGGEGQASGLFPMPAPARASAPVPTPTPASTTTTSTTTTTSSSSSTPTTATQTQPARPSTGAGAGAGPHVDEGAVTQIMGMGFDRASAVRALVAAGGNVDLAVSILMGF